MKKMLYLLSTVLFLNACGVKYKTIPYFVDLPVKEDVEENINNKTVIKIQKDDILSITVSSPSVESNLIFNLANNNVAEGSSGASNPINGFIVDQQGNVQLPYLGTVKVEGLTTAAARELIEKQLNDGNFLKSAVVSLRLANFKISVLGDVTRPGVYPIQNERVTVLEALSMAGDLTITGMRENVLLIRENNGKREQIRLNLQSKDLMNSPYYYLQTNDAIYVQPGPAKYASVDSSYRTASFVLSALSIIVLIVTRL